MKNIIYILFALLTITTGCQDVIELEVPEGRTRLVVDGLVTDASATQTVKLKYTAPYFSNTSTPAATGAEVFITDNEGNKFLLEESEPGLYQADFQAQVGNSFTVCVAEASVTRPSTTRRVRPSGTSSSITSWQPVVMVNRAKRM